MKKLTRKHQRLRIKKIVQLDAGELSESLILNDIEFRFKIKKISVSV